MWLNLARLLIILLTLLLAWMTYRTNILLKQFRPSFNVLLSPPDTVARFGLVGLCLFIAWLSGLPASQLGFTASTPVMTLMVGVAIGMVVQLLVNLISHWVIHQFGDHLYASWLIDNILPRRPLEWLLVPLAFIPAVTVEELLFRSLLLGGFIDTLPMSILVIMSSLIFGFMHQLQGVIGGVGAAILNILLSMLFIWSGELLLPLVVHYTINILQLITINFMRMSAASQPHQ